MNGPNKYFRFFRYLYKIFAETLSGSQTSLFKAIRDQELDTVKNMVNYYYSNVEGRKKMILLSEISSIIWSFSQTLMDDQGKRPKLAKVLPIHCPLLTRVCCSTSYHFALYKGKHDFLYMELT